jgi:hypothetical protein
MLIFKIHVLTESVWHVVAMSSVSTLQQVSGMTRLWLVLAGKSTGPRGLS